MGQVTLLNSEVVVSGVESMVVNWVAYRHVVGRVTADGPFCLSHSHNLNESLLILQPLTLVYIGLTGVFFLIWT